MKPRYSRMILRVLYDSLYLTRNMDVFDKYYHTYRIVLKIIGLWPYNNSVYVWIQRLCISALFLGNIIFQVTKIIIFLYIIHCIFTEMFYWILPIHYLLMLPFIN